MTPISLTKYLLSDVERVGAWWQGIDSVWLKNIYFNFIGLDTQYKPNTRHKYIAQISSVTQLCDPMNHSTPGLPVHHQLLESTQTHVHCVGDAIQPSLPLTSPSPPALTLSQHQGFFQCVSSSYQVAKYWSFSFNISPPNEHPRLISFRRDWVNLLAVQGIEWIVTFKFYQRK